MPQKRGSLDYTLQITVLMLVVFGLVTLYSTSAYNGRVRFLDSGYYFKKQLFATALGLAAMAVISRTDYHLLARYALALKVNTSEYVTSPYGKFVDLQTDLKG